MMTPLSEPPGSARQRIYRAALRLFAANGASEITVSELAEAAGIARGTIYNNIDAPEKLFGDVSTALSSEMLQRTEATMRGIDDPVRRMAMGMRLFIRRAHDEHDWGAFLVRFGLSHSALRAMMHGPPARDIGAAIEAKRFKADVSFVPALLSLQNGATMSAMNCVIRGDQTWRDAGAKGAELFLRAGGVAAAEAHRIANEDLPPLAAAPRARATRQKQS